MAIRIKRHRSPAVALLAGVAALAAACAARGTAEAQTAAAPVAAPTTQLAAGAGAELVQQNCSACHAVGLSVSRRRSSAEWTDTLARMEGFGLQLSADAKAQVHAYLSRNYAPLADGPAPGPVPIAPAAAATFPRPSGANQWPAYGGGGANSNFSPLAQITPANVAGLVPAWTYRYGAGRSASGDQGLDYRFQSTPLLIGGVMYLSTPSFPLAPDLKAAVVALVPETGEVLWKYESPLNIHGRGLAYWPGTGEIPPRLFFGTDRGMLVALDVTTGLPAAGFGREGQIDGYIGVASEIVGDSRRATYTIPNPVTIYRNLIITGGRPGEAGPPGPRGDIRAFDAITGRLVWTFHTVPQPGEPNHESWLGEEWRDVTGANVWSTMALDEENGIVYAPTGDGNSGAAGSHLYSSSVVALDAATGALRWFRQLTHRDIWDWDAPTPPLLTDLEIDGQTVPAVIVTGKHSLFFMFNRLTGEPLNGFSERPTPQPSTPSAEVWPTQPFPDAPGPIARTSMTRAEIPDLVPGMRDACQQYWDENGIISPPLYAPRQSPDAATLTYPLPTGGPNWGGGSYHPDLGLYIINMQNRPVYRPRAAPGTGPGMMNRNAAGAGGPPRLTGVRPPPGFSFRTADGLTLSCGATPWGELVAVDVNTRTIAWRSTLGMTLALGEAGRNTGTANLGGNIVTASGLVFIGATNDRRFRAFDARSGEQLWETELEASAHATPVSYMGRDGKQYVVVAAGGGTSAGGPEMSDTLVAYRLP